MLDIHKLMAALFAVFLFAGAAHSASYQGYVYEVSGDVQAAIGTAKPVKVEKNQNLGNNTTITTGANSTAVLKFIDGTVIALNQNTAFLIDKYEYNEKSPSTMSALFSILRGGLRALTGALSSRNRESFKLATPVATIGIRGTDFMVQMVNPGYLAVTQGLVSVTNGAGTATFGAGSTAVVPSFTTLATSIAAVPAGTFGTLPQMTLPPAVPGPVPVPGAAAAGTSAAGAAAGGITGGVAVGIGAAAIAVGAAAGGGSKNTTGTTGTK